MSNVAKRVETWPYNEFSALNCRSIITKKMSKSFVVSKNVLIFAPPNVQIKPNKKT